MHLWPFTSSVCYWCVVICHIWVLILSIKTAPREGDFCPSLARSHLGVSSQDAAVSPCNQDTTADWVPIPVNILLLSQLQRTFLWHRGLGNKGRCAACGLWGVVYQDQCKHCQCQLPAGLWQLLSWKWKTVPLWHGSSHLFLKEGGRRSLGQEVVLAEWGGANIWHLQAVSFRLAHPAQHQERSKDTTPRTLGFCDMRHSANVSFQWKFFSLIAKHEGNTTERTCVPFQRMNSLEEEFGLEEMGEVGCFQPTVLPS